MEEFEVNGSRAITTVQMFLTSLIAFLYPITFIRLQRLKVISSRTSIPFLLIYLYYLYFFVWLLLRTMGFSFDAKSFLFYFEIYFFNACVILVMNISLMAWYRIIVKNLVSQLKEKVRKATNQINRLSYVQDMPQEAKKKRQTIRAITFFYKFLDFSCSPLCICLGMCLFFALYFIIWNPIEAYVIYKGSPPLKNFVFVFFYVEVVAVSCILLVMDIIVTRESFSTFRKRYASDKKFWLKVIRFWFYDSDIHFSRLENLVHIFCLTVWILYIFLANYFPSYRSTVINLVLEPLISEIIFVFAPIYFVLIMALISNLKFKELIAVEEHITNEEIELLYKDQLAFTHFKEFASKEWSVENVDLYSDLMSLKTDLNTLSNFEDYKEKVFKIYETYVPTGSVLEVNISAAVRQTIKEKMDYLQTLVVPINEEGIMFSFADVHKPKQKEGQPSEKQDTTQQIQSTSSTLVVDNFEDSKSVRSSFESIRTKQLEEIELKESTPNIVTFEYPFQELEGGVIVNLKDTYSRYKVSLLHKEFLEKRNVAKQLIQNL